MDANIDNTYNNLLLAFCVLVFKLFSAAVINEWLSLGLTCLSIISVILLIIINFKKAYNIIFKKDETNSTS